LETANVKNTMRCLSYLKLEHISLWICKIDMIKINNFTFVCVSFGNNYKVSSTI